MTDIIFVDTETTGLDPERHEVWEIAYAINDGPVESFQVPHSLRNADPLALGINRYYHRVSADYFGDDLPPSREEILQQALAGNYLCAANPSFDTAFLKARWGVEPWHHRKIDIQSFAMPAMGQWGKPPSMNDIVAFCRSTGAQITQNDHTAGNDVKALQQCYYALCRMYAVSDLV